MVRQRRAPVRRGDGDHGPDAPVRVVPRRQRPGHQSAHAGADQRNLRCLQVAQHMTDRFGAAVDPGAQRHLRHLDGCARLSGDAAQAAKVFERHPKNPGFGTAHETVQKDVTGVIPCHASP
jgi:hypothetical protein